ncbi:MULTISPECIES: hypothetical protein [unclassified Helicobacter]|uniref:hypothetical protein n=1 Tax=unclassified Helicobacter TaxID=2593540 RepID=UPI000CF03D7F|nr:MULTISPECIES: hypothetical protein [unclassified Helicobacter]
MLKTNAFIIPELLLAISLIFFCLYLFSNFSKQYNISLKYINHLQNITKAQVALIKKQDVLEIPIQLQTKNLICEAILIKNHPNSSVIFQSYEVQECR